MKDVIIIGDGMGQDGRLLNLKNIQFLNKNFMNQLQTIETTLKKDNRMDTINFCVDYTYNNLIKNGN